MASLYHPRYPTGTLSPYWNLNCYQCKKAHRPFQLALKYPDGQRIQNQREAWKLLKEHEATCASHSPVPSCPAAIDAYLQATRSLRGLRTQQQDGYKAASWKAALGALVLSQLSRSVITERLDTLQAERGWSPVTRDHYLKFLKAFVRWAVYVKEWLPKDVTQGIKKIGRSPSRPCVPEERWDELLTKAKASPYRLGVMLCLMAGLRSKELLQLEMRDVDLKRQVLTIRAEIAKTGEGTSLPLMDELGPLLKPALTTSAPTTKLCPYRARAFQEQIRVWLQEMGYTGYGLGPHVLRHSFVTWAVQRFGMATARRLARHRSIQTTDRYTHLSMLPISPAQMTRRDLHFSSTLRVTPPR